MWSLPLPGGAEPPYEVYVNGERRDDFVVDGRWIRFATPLRPQPPLGFWRRVMLGIGIGVYGDLKGDSVDIRFSRSGISQVQSGVTIIPPSDSR